MAKRKMPGKALATSGKQKTIAKTTSKRASQLDFDYVLALIDAARARTLAEYYFVAASGNYDLAALLAQAQEPT
jgi:hypothetical protein